jgi:integrase
MKTATKTTASTKGTLTESKARALKGDASSAHAIEHLIAPNLYLKVAPTGAKSFQFKMSRTVPGESKPDRVIIGLGSWDIDGSQVSTGARMWLTWSAAIGHAAMLKSEASKGNDPRKLNEAFRESFAPKKTEAQEEAEALEAMKKASTRSKRITVKDACTTYIDDVLTEGKQRDPKTINFWHSTFRKYVYPTIGNKLVHLVTNEDMLKILRPIWVPHYDTASRVQKRMEAVFGWAMRHKYMDRAQGNPALWKDHLEHDLASRTEARRMNPVKEKRAMHFDDIPAFYFDLRARLGTSASALRFKTLTLLRTSEVRGAQWEEFDLKARTWTLPASRMKGRHAGHTVALSDAAINVLKSMPGGVKKQGLVFPVQRGRKGDLHEIQGLSRYAMRDLMVRMGYNGLASPHTLRHSFRTWAAAQQRFNPAVCEAVLAHIEGTKMELTYNLTHQHENYLEHRFEVMEAWGDYVMSGTNGAANVVPLVDPRKRSGKWIKSRATKTTAAA